MSRVSLSIELDVSQGPPAEFRIFPSGAFETLKGTFLFDAQAAKSVMAAVADWGNDYCIDYGHSMLSFFSLDPAKAMKAAGWFKPVLRNGELIATEVRWNDEAAQMLAKREARYISPAFNTDDDDDNRISELVNLALTNIPATKKQTPLVASRSLDRNKKEKQMSKKKLSAHLLYKLGLPPDADDATVLATIDGLKEGERKAEEDREKELIAEMRAKAERERTKTEPVAREPDLATLAGRTANEAAMTERARAESERARVESERRLNDLTGMKTYGESLGVVLSWKGAVSDVEKLHTRIAELEQKGQGATAEALVEQGIRENKITPAQRELWLTIGRKDPEVLRGYLSTAASVIPKKVERQLDAKPMVALTEEQKKAAAKLGLTDQKTLDSISEQMAEAQAVRAGGA